MGTREKNSQVRHSKKLLLFVPFFGKEGKGEICGARRELFSELLWQDSRNLD